MTTADWLTLCTILVGILGTVLVPVFLVIWSQYRKFNESHKETREIVIRQDERLKALEASQPRQDTEINNITRMMQEMRVWMSGQFGAIREALHMQSENGNPPQ